MQKTSRRDFVVRTASLAAAGAFAPALAQSRPIKIGVNIVSSGPTAVVGRDVLAGIDMFFDSIKYTAAGRKIEVIKEDETADVQTAVAKARKLIEGDQVDCLIGGSLTSTAYATLPIAVSTKTPYLIAIAGAAEITRSKRRNPFTYRTSYNTWQIAYPFGQYVAEKVSKNVFITAADYAAGHEWSAAFKSGLTAAGGKMTGELYPPLGSPDFVPFVTKIGQDQPEAIFALFFGTDAIRFLKAFDDLGLKRKTKLTIFGGSIDYDTLPAQGQSAVGAISQHWWNLDLKNPVNELITATFTEKYKRIPSANVSLGWDAANAVVSAVNANGGDTSNKERLAAAFGGLKLDSARGPIEIDAQTHDVIQDLYVRETVAGDPLPEHKVIAKIPQVRDPFPNG
jgi:branched-chain amino acid transport system substrate-binding protein